MGSLSQQCTQWSTWEEALCQNHWNQSQQWEQHTTGWWELPNGVGAPKSTEEHDSLDNTHQSGDGSTQDELRENAADSDLESASSDCPSCSDMEKLAIRKAQKRFWKRVWASCSIVRGSLSLKAQVKQIKDIHQAIWDSDLKIVRTESWSLSRRITPPLKWIEWPPKLNNYLGSKRPPTLKSTHGSQRPRSMVGRRPLCNLWNNSKPTSTYSMKRVQHGQWSTSWPAWD